MTTILNGRKTVGRKACRLLLILLLLTAAGPAFPDDVPFSAFNGPAYYSSTESKPIKVVLSVRDVKPVLEVPSAFLNFAVGYEQPQHLRLPQVLETRAVKVSLRLPSGRPHVLMAAETRGKEVGEKIRPYIAFIDIRATVDASATIQAYQSSRMKYPEPPYQALTAWTANRSSYRSMEYFPPRSMKSFYGISCNDTGYVNQYCKYEIEICPRVVASANFVDFRFHGGVEFAESRAKEMQKIVRGWMKSCN